MKKRADSQEQQQNSGVETGMRAPRMRSLPSPPDHLPAPTSLGISERDEGKGLMPLCWKHSTKEKNSTKKGGNNELQCPVVALK